MKAMNYLFTITLLFLLGSCSKDAPMENEELDTVEHRGRIDQKQLHGFLNGLDMYKRSADVQLYELEEHIAELREAMERGERGHEEELENIQRKRELMAEYRELLDTFVRPRGGRGPGPRPPRGCFVANCRDGIDLNGISGIAIPKETTVERIVIKDRGGNIIGQGTEMSESPYGDPMMQFEASEFEGVGTMHINTTARENGIGAINIEIPVSFE